VQLTTLFTGAVLCVRWMNDHGTLLASGSDDTKIVLWELYVSSVCSGATLGLMFKGTEPRKGRRRVLVIWTEM
jgi:hypothetical protein